MDAKKTLPYRERFIATGVGVGQAAEVPWMGSTSDVDPGETELSSVEMATTPLIPCDRMWAYRSRYWLGCSV